MSQLLKAEATSTKITATFKDGSPAQVDVAIGAGTVTYAGYHPGMDGCGLFLD